MKPDRAVIRKYFSKLGLDEEIADMYLALHEFGPQSISDLSRNSGVERTKVYRLIDQLLDSNLVELDANYKKGVLKAAPIANLNILISRKAQELEGLQDELELVQQVLARNSLSSPATRVQFYYGSQGARQLHWNIVKTKTEVLGILHSTASMQAASRFRDRWTAACNDHEVVFRIISNSAVTGLETLQDAENRVVSPDIFPISHTTWIYDDTVAFLNWKDDEIYGQETYSKEIAGTQTQLFELLWKSTQ